MIDEKTGIPVVGERIQRGRPRIDGVDHGASGAQLIGKDIHDPHQNQHESHRCISSSIDVTFDSISGESHTVTVSFPLEKSTGSTKILGFAVSLSASIFSFRSSMVMVSM